MDKAGDAVQRMLLVAYVMGVKEKHKLERY